MTTNRKPAAGRRPGDSGTRDAILAAAAEAFYGHGYEGATMRGIARAADVDAALVVHFFGNKDGLFSAVLEGGVNPMRRIAEFADAPTHQLGERLIARYIEVWEAPETAARMATVLRAVATSPTAAKLLRSFISVALLAPISDRLGVEDASLRANLCGAHLSGISLTRYILKVEPLATLEPERLAAFVGPCLQHYLTGELGGVLEEPLRASG